MKQKVKFNLTVLILFFIPFLMLLGLFIWTITLDTIFIAYWILIGTQLLFCFVVLVLQSITVIRLYKVLNSGKNIVKGTLINIEERPGRNGRKVYIFWFKKYGKYFVPLENYTWSKVYDLSADGVYNYSSCGDEFYLVLSKPYTGKILLAYNTKMFEFEN